MAAWASVVFVPGFTEKMRDIADSTHDMTGLMLEEGRLLKRIRLKRKL
ncbi:MAG: hypothetical protein FWC19_09540 [Treponema sp.]|nr:hypothetical protein [Treponema sp.]MCL2273027.1 hypothetical protein [Treponema sp.]